MKIWEDHWLPKGSTRKPATPRRSCLLTKVSELIDPLTGEWDEQLIRDIFWPQDADEILQIPINDQMEDWPVILMQKGNFQSNQLISLLY